MNCQKPVLETLSDDCELTQEHDDVELDMEPEEEVDSKEVVIKLETADDDLEQSGFGFWNADMKVKDEPVSDSDEETDESDPKKKKKRASAVDVPEIGREITEKGIEKFITNESTELLIKFENGEISSPNDPEYWKNIITHYSVLGHLDKARGVAKQALDTIDYRNEKGKLEVWGSLLQLELKYGTEETVKKTYADALQRNDAFEWLKLAAVVGDGQCCPKGAESILSEMTKKFRLKPD